MTPALGEMLEPETHSVENGVIQYLSASQLNTFERCPRQWYFEKVMRIRPPPKPWLKRGTENHQQLEFYMQTGDQVLGDIARPAMRYLPVPKTPGLLIEQPLAEPTIHAAGIPFTPRGKLDLAWVEEDEGVRTGVIYDYKTTSDFARAVSEFGATPEALAKDLQLTVYSKWMLARFPDIEAFRWRKLYLQTRGARGAFPVDTPAPLTTVAKNWDTVLSLAERMTNTAQLKSFEQVSIENRKPGACASFGGCPHLSRCFSSPIERIQMSLLKTLRATQPASIPPAVAAQPAQIAQPQQVAPPQGPPAPVHATTAPNGAQVSDGPGWVMIHCEICGEDLAKRPPGHKISPALCPRASKHPAHPVSVLPPDAPASNPALASEQPAAPAVKKAGRPRKIQIIDESTPDVPASPVPTQAAPAVSAPAVASVDRGPGPTPQSTPAPAAVAVSQPPSAAPSANVSPAPVVTATDLKLYVNCIPVGVSYELLDGYAARLNAAVSKVSGSPDYRLVEFGKGRGMLTALARAEPPAGTVVALFDGEGLLSHVVEALRPLCKPGNLVIG